MRWSASCPDRVSAAQHHVGLAWSTRGARTCRQGPAWPIAATTLWSELAEGTLAWHVVAFALLKFILGLSVLGAKWD